MNYPSDTSDADLVRYAQEGLRPALERREAVGLLYDRHQDQIFNYLWIRVNDRQLAEDLTGEVFIRMVTALPNFRVREIPFLAWLYRIAHNLMVDHFRKNNHGNVVPIEEVNINPPSTPDLYAAVERRLSLVAVQNALRKLDPLSRDVLILRFMVGMPIKDVASILEKSVPTVKALQHRGLKSLRRILEEA